MARGGPIIDGWVRILLKIGFRGERILRGSKFNVTGLFFGGYGNIIIMPLFDLNSFRSSPASQHLHTREIRQATL